MDAALRPLQVSTDGEPPDLLSTGELARRAGRSREWLLKKIRAGHVRALRTEGGQFLVTIDEARRFLTGAGVR
jgi:hypothetical protein